MIYPSSKHNSEQGKKSWESEFTPVIKSQYKSSPYNSLPNTEWEKPPPPVELRQPPPPPPPVLTPKSDPYPPTLYALREQQDGALAYKSKFGSLSREDVAPVPDLSSYKQQYESKYPR